MLMKNAVRFGTALALALAAPALAQDTEATEVSRDTIVATVNGTDITVGHMIVLRQQLPQQYQQLPDEVLFDGVLEQLIRQTLLADQVEETPRSVEIRLENERRALLATEIVADVAGAAVTEEALQAAYDAAVAGMEPTQEYNASHILVETEEKAAGLVEDLEGGADFAELAREHSTGPTGPNGGNLDWFEAGQMVQPFAEAVQTMEVGAISEPVQTQFGWHVVKLNDTREKPVPTLDEMRGELAEQLQQQAVEAEIERLVEGAEVNRADLGGLDRSVLGNDALLEN